MLAGTCTTSVYNQCEIPLFFKKVPASTPGCLESWIPRIPLLLTCEQDGAPPHASDEEEKMGENCTFAHVFFCVFKAIKIQNEHCLNVQMKRAQNSESKTRVKK